MTSSAARVTVPQLEVMKREGRKIVVATAYDFPTAQIADEAGVDVILVGDSLAVVVQGHETTLPVTVEQMLYHTEMVRRATQRALVVGDLPFGSYQQGPAQAIDVSVRFLKETGCDAVKLESGPRQMETIEALVGAGIPVMAHVGLKPQSIRSLGAYRVQRSHNVVDDAKAAEQAGAFSIVLECVSSEIAREATSQLAIPTIGIGAGPHCDGQVLVFHDFVGLTAGRTPKFVKKFADVRSLIRDATAAYCDEVRRGAYPDADYSYE
ncbi:MAG TPA: 3-methyl-2-oxobutanoate hydroxymethyltransferase [Pirellulaceae bacterium]|jgi:3-methyl-2-oxobutanoate hydroxymethyltransferase|nr:3-methyl-2-oxobutanoate hydroxymethyltransferase [Pirellulaceae bacterium]